MWALGAVFVIALSGRAWAQAAALPPGIQDAGSLTSDQRSQLSEFIASQVEALQSASSPRTRSQARDLLLGMFDGASVSTAFRLAASQSLAGPLADMIASDDEFLRFSGFRLAARTAADDTARIFEKPIAAGDKPNRLVALGQVRVLFLEVDRGGLAVQPATLDRLSGTIGRLLAEETDPHLALYEIRALRALTSAKRTELASSAKTAMSQLARGVNVRLKNIPTRPFGSSEENRIELLVHLEAMDGIRNMLVSSAGGNFDPAFSADLGTYSGQVLATVMRLYERVPKEAEDVKRQFERLTERAGEVVSQLVLRTAGAADVVKAVPSAKRLADLLRQGDLRNFKLEVLPLVGPDGSLMRLYKLPAEAFRVE